MNLFSTFSIPCYIWLFLSEMSISLYPPVVAKFSLLHEAFSNFLFTSYSSCNIFCCYGLNEMGRNHNWGAGECCGALECNTWTGVVGKVYTWKMNNNIEVILQKQWGRREKSQ